MRRTRSLLLCLLMLASSAASAFAEEPYELVFGERGFTLRFPEGAPAEEGLLYAEDGGELGGDAACVYIYYIALPEARFRELLGKQRSEKEQDELYSAVCPLCTVYTVGGGKDFGAVSDLFAAYGYELDAARTEELAQVGEYRFYACDEQLEAELDAAFAAEYAATAEALQAALAAGEYYEPLPPFSEMVGQLVRFETTDLDGETVDSAELFAEHALTMVNVWATWCPPCVGELGELDALNERIAELDCAVVGVLLDGDEAGAPEQARKLMEEKDAHYRVLLPMEKVDELFPLEAIPTSYFVDRNGVIVAPPIIGARVDEYAQTFRDLLTDAAPAATANREGLYRVFVVDGSGVPVSGAAVQLCSESVCHTAVTDESGLATFSVERDSYSASILKVPEGFTASDTKYPMLETYSDLTITLG